MARDNDQMYGQCQKILLKIYLSAVVHQQKKVFVKVWTSEAKAKTITICSQGSTKQTPGFNEYISYTDITENPQMLRI